MQRDPIRYAIVGYGTAGRGIHLPLLKWEPRFQLRGVFARRHEVREQVALEHPRARTYETQEAMLADEQLDLVIITTPHNSHAPLAIAALNAGKHVVTDKPMCLTLAEHDAMVDAQRRSGKLLNVFHNARLSGDYLTLRSIVESGKLGELRWLEIDWNRHGLSKRSAWRNKADEHGGRMIDLGVHLIDQALQLFPERVTSVYTRMNRDWPDAGVESACMVTIGFEGGRTVILDVGSMTRIPKPKYHAVGTLGTWTKPGGLVDPQDAALASGNWEDANEDIATTGTLVDATGSYPTPTTAGDWRKYYQNLADVLLSGADPIVKLDEMRRVIQVLEAAVTSARTGQLIDL